MPTQLSAREFVDKWRGVELKERSAAQEHFIDLCRLIGHPTPAEADPEGTHFCFEKGATKQRGGQGWADVWKQGCFAWEFKGPHADLDAAYQQLLQYREALMNPPLLVVSDLERIVVHTNFTNTVKQVIAIGLEDLLRPDGRQRLADVFTDPEAFRAPQTPEQVTQEAAAQFARLADLLRRYGAPPDQAAHFLIRLLFCLFAEDVGLLPHGLLGTLISRARTRPGAFAQQMRLLFQAMAEGGWFGEHEIRHFDGRLFDDSAVLDLDGDSMRVLERVARLDWSTIEPSVFGTLFERSLDPTKRSQLGAHYTSKEDILLIVEPVLMAPLRRRWAEVAAQARELAARRDEKLARAVAEFRRPGDLATIRNASNAELARLLGDFAQALAAVQVLDASCGSGNFLYIALRELLNLWKEVSVLAADLGLPRMLALSDAAPSPEQLHGIEVNAYAHELAQATIWIGYIQWLNENGFGLPAEPILKPLDNILHMDAVLAYDEAGHPVEPEWPAADVIIGNPPFLGGNKIRQELGDAYVESLFRLYSGRVPAFADLVCYWFEKARMMIASGIVDRAGLLATQGIRGGANREVLERIKETGDIFWAQADRDWILDGAAVHVSMVGFDDGMEQNRSLDGQQVESINPDLTSSVDLTKAQTLNENADLAFMGMSKKGPFDIDSQTAEGMLNTPVNPNGRTNRDVVRPIMNGLDLTGQSRNMWIIDFGTQMSQEEAALYELPFEYVKQNVYPTRRQNRRQSYRENWWRLAEARPGLREALKPLSRFIATPTVSKHRVFAWLDVEIVPDQQIIAFARQDDFFFGLLHSKVHELWSRRTGTQVRDAESGFRYTPKTTFETFPFPWPPGQEPQDDPRVQAIAQAARELVEKRDRWLNPEGASAQDLKRRTLTNLYNQRPTWLDMAHQKLDAAVLAAYGWPGDLGAEAILERLLALNLARAGGNG